jgi:hypothetical protein
VQTDRIAMVDFRRKTPPDAEQFAGLHAASDRRGLQQEKAQEAFPMKETGCRCHNFALPNFQKMPNPSGRHMMRVKKTSPGTTLQIRLEDRTCTCFTLPSVFCSNPAGSRTQTERRTLFHILPFWTAAHLHQYTVNGSGTFMSC